MGAGGGNQRKASPVLVTSLWGMFYAADEVAVILQPHEQLRKMTGVIVVVCAAFGLTVISDAKTEIIMYLCTKGIPKVGAIFTVETAGQVNKQTNEIVYLGGNVNHDAYMSAEVSRSIRNA